MATENIKGIFNGPAAANTDYYKITAKGKDSAEIMIYGDIGESWFSDGVGAKQFVKDLKALGDIKTLDIHINSRGGSVFEGLAIHNQLKSHKAFKNVHIDGEACSIASVIVMAGDKVHMPENAMMMIHDPSALVAGNADEMRKMADVLDKVKLSLVTAYRRSGQTDEELHRMMAEETWMSAEEAKAMGFCDVITNEMKLAASGDLSVFKNVPASVLFMNIQKMGSGSAPAAAASNQQLSNSDLESVIDHKEDKTMKCSVCGKELVNGTCPHCAAQAAAQATILAARTAEAARVSEIMAIGQKHGCLDTAIQFINEGKSIDDMRTEVLNKISSGPGNVTGPTVGSDDKPFRNFGEQLMAVRNAAIKPNAVDKRLYQIQNAALGANEAVPSDGGFLVQQDFTTELLAKVNETGVLPARCRRIPIGDNSNGLKAPIIDETSRATGSRWGGIRVYRTNEAAAVANAGKPKFGLLDLSLEKLMGVCYSTEELLRDSSALGAIMTQAFSEEFGFVLDDEILNGDGTGKCLGILNSNALVTVAKETGQTTKTIVGENIINMYSRMYSRGKANGVWLINTETWPQIMKINLTIGTAGVPLFMPPGGLSGAPYGSLLGRPILELEQCAALGTTGDIIFADLMQYLLIEKDGMSAEQSIHVQFLTDETAFRFIIRNNGQPMWKSALTPYKGSATVSPFVALGTR